MPEDLPEPIGQPVMEAIVAACPEIVAKYESLKGELRQKLKSIDVLHRQTIRVMRRRNRAHESTWRPKLEEDRQEFIGHERCLFEDRVKHLIEEWRNRAPPQASP